jgi:hypothetical protein
MYFKNKYYLFHYIAKKDLQVTKLCATDFLFIICIYNPIIFLYHIRDSNSLIHWSQVCAHEKT